MTLTHIDLFAGIMGFSLGFERAGIETVAYVEIDPVCQSVIRRHRPDALILSDVRDVGAHNLPYADIISFGSPCQDLSVAGNRKGLSGARSGLFFQAIRIVRELKPTFAIWENVPGAFSSHAGRDFYHVLDAFLECGARDIAWATLDAQHFGVPQRRRRVFVIADFRIQRAGEILLIPESGAGHPEPRTSQGEGTTAPTGRGAASRSYNEQRSDQYTDASVASTLASRDGKGVRTVVAGTLGLAASRNRGIGSANEADMLIAEAIDVRNLRSNGDISGTLQSKANGGYSLNYQNPIAFMAGQGAKAGSIAASETTAPTLKGVSSGTNQVPTVAICAGTGDDLSPSLTSEGADASEDGRGRHAFAVNRAGVRRLTPTECERLQGFPDGWTETGANGAISDSQRYRMLGNAVAVPVIEWIGRRIVAAAEEYTP